MKYQDGKIYKILNSRTNDVYVGATCQRLAKRMMNHRTRVKEGKETLLYNKMRDIGIEYFYIELIENYPCENSEQLNKREGDWMREIATLNEKVAGRTKKEYKTDCKEKIKEQGKEYYEQRQGEICAKHRQRYNEITSVKMTCEVCKTIHNKKNKPLHSRSKKHQEALNNLNNINNVSSESNNIQANGEETEG